MKLFSIQDLELIQEDFKCSCSEVETVLKKYGKELKLLDENSFNLDINIDILRVLIVREQYIRQLALKNGIVKKHLKYLNSGISKDLKENINALNEELIELLRTRNNIIKDDYKYKSR